MTIESCIRSLSPGRARIRHPALKGLEGEELSKLAGAIASYPGIISAEINPRVGSLLIYWDEDRASAEQLLAAARLMLPPAEEAPAPEKAEEKEACGAGIADAIASLLVPGAASPRRRRRIAQNRVMLGSLGVSLAALAVRGAAAHTVAGAFFVALLASHLFQHRRVV